MIRGLKNETRSSLRWVRAPSCSLNGMAALHPPTISDHVQVNLIAVYIAFAGIYWLPGVSPVFLSTIKLVLFFAFFSIGMVRFKNCPAEQSSIYAWLGIGAFCVFVTTSITTNFRESFDQARNFIEPLLWLIALSGIRARAYPLLISRLKTAFLLFFFVSLYPVGVFYGLLPNHQSPIEFNRVSEIGLNWYEEVGSGGILRGGFNIGRTGWGVTVSSAALFLIALYLYKKKITTKTIMFSLVIVVGSLASIISAGARGGAFTLLFVVLLAILEARRHLAKKIFIFLIVLIFISFFSVAELFAFLPDLFSRNFDATGDAFTRLNLISTGRLETYVGGFKHFFESPLIGKGPVEGEVGIFNGQRVEVHNLWISSLAEFGIFGFFPILILTIKIALLARLPYGNKIISDSGLQWPLVRYVVVCSFILAMAEPGLFFGAFNIGVILWTSVWMLLQESSTTRLTKVEC